jgi:hypothetical protein
MYEKMRGLFRFITGRDTPGRYLKVRDDDTFLVSYPRSGNTWTRFLIANLMRPGQTVTLVTADRIIPNVDGQSKKYFNQMAGPRVIKSHYPFHQSYKRVVYVVRDPRDVIVSQYHFQLKRGVLPQSFPIESFLPGFLAGEVSPYGSWRENVASWLAARRSDPRFLLIRYEDLLKQTEVELARVATLIGIEPETERIALAVERSSAARMRELEKKESQQWASTKGTRQDVSFIRAASDGQWRSALPEECVAKIESAWGDVMQILGYAPVLSKARQGLFQIYSIEDPETNVAATA